MTNIRIEWGKVFAVTFIIIIFFSIIVPSFSNMKSEVNSGKNFQYVNNYISEAKKYYEINKKDIDKIAYTNIIDKLKIDGVDIKDGEVSLDSDGLVGIALIIDNKCYYKSYSDEFEDTLVSTYNNDCSIIMNTSMNCFDYTVENDDNITINEYFEYEKDDKTYPKCPENIVIPKDFTRIKNNAFNGKKIKSVVIPNNIKYIGTSAFSDNQLTSIKVSNDISYLGDYAFSNNRIKHISLPDSLTTISKGLLYNNNLKTINFGKNTKVISSNAFESNSLTSVELPNTLIEIGDNSFKNNKLTSLKIPNSVESIDEWAFFQNDLSSIEIPNSVKSIKMGSFNNNSMSGKEAYIYSRDENGKSDNTRLLSYAGKTKDKVVLPDSIKIIEDRAFYGCYINSIVFSDYVEDIGDWAFYENNLTDLVIPDNVKKIGDYAFKFNSLKSVIIKGKSSINDFEYYPYQSPFEWDNFEKNDSTIIWQK